VTGPLAGTTFAVKDIFDVAGYVTGCGNLEKEKESPPATANAAVVQKLLDAGARFVGKVHTAELAFSLDGRNEHTGTPLNPAAPDRVPGGSSSGSASAVAAGVVDFALGSDTGGSVRGPASFCGLIGLRPTHGRIDLTGTMALAGSFDTPGWFTRSMELYEKIGTVLLGDDIEGPPLAHAVIAEDAFALMEGDDERAALAAGVAAAKQVLAFDGAVTVGEGKLTDWQNIYRTMQGREAWRVHGPWIEARKPKLNPAVAVRFAAARDVSEAAYQEAQAERLQAMQRVHEILGKDRVIVLPTMPGIAPLLAASEEDFEAFRWRALPLTSISGLSGAPQITLPVATVNGCPLGLSLIAPPGRDRALIALAARVLAAIPAG
jgi:amidase